MGKIATLPQGLANRIAAGEVVERPASVVKELVENSLDAGAKRVEIVIEAGGRGLISVADDGEGMDREDLGLCLLSHATSKLRSEEELGAIASLGFRGEALAAIASVSLLRVETSARDDGRGWRLSARGGEIEEIVEAARERGTTVAVQSLFFNTPARRKFLRSEAREGAVIAETVTRLALAHPDRGFSLVSDGRPVVNVPPGQTRAERVGALGGIRTVPLCVAGSKDGARLEAYATGAGESRSDRSGLRIIVSGRPVQDRSIAHALASAYAPVLPPGRHPVVTLYLDLPADGVDVNVHPAKAEVRFRRPGTVHDLVAGAFRRALREAGALAAIAPPDPQGGEETAGEGWQAPVGPAPAEPLPLEAPGRSGSLAETRQRYAAQSGPAGEGLGRGLAGEAVALAQYRDSYIVAEDDEGILLVDQHAAHERVLFEKLLDAGRGRPAGVQPLLEPAAVPLQPAETLLLEEAGESLRAFGFEIEPFGGGTALVRSVPGLFSGMDPAALLTDILEDLARDRLPVEVEAGAEGSDPEAEAWGREEPGTGTGSRAGRLPGENLIDRRLRLTAAAAACQAAIKVNFPLTREKMNWLLLALAACRVPTSCPHGRPTTLRLSHEFIERRFLRI